MSDSPQKQCSKCQQILPATPEFFSRNRSKKDGFGTECKTCMREYHKQHYQAHKEEIDKKREVYCETHKEQMSAYYKKYNGNRKEEMREYDKQYHEGHKEWHHKQHKQYYLSNREERIANQQQYAKTSQGRMVHKAHNHKRKAQKRASQGAYTAQQLQEQMHRQKSKCYYCKVKLSKVWHADHVVPLSRGGSNDISNIVIACPTCNMRKHARLPHEWPEGGRLL